MAGKCFARLEKEMQLIDKDRDSEIFKVVHLDSAFDCKAEQSINLNWRVAFVPLLQEHNLHQPLLLDIVFPEKYPFEPPVLKLISPSLNHPNIDAQGNLCMDILKLPPNVNFQYH